MGQHCLLAYRQAVKAYFVASGGSQATGSGCEIFGDYRQFGFGWSPSDAVLSAIYHAIVEIRKGYRQRELQSVTTDGIMAMDCCEPLGKKAILPMKQKHPQVLHVTVNTPAGNFVTGGYIQDSSAISHSIQGLSRLNTRSGFNPKFITKDDLPSQASELLDLFDHVEDLMCFGTDLKHFLTRITQTARATSAAFGELGKRLSAAVRVRNTRHILEITEALRHGELRPGCKLVLAPPKSGDNPRELIVGDKTWQTAQFNANFLEEEFGFNVDSGIEVAEGGIPTKRWV
jgi:hypothetical protein